MAKASLHPEAVKLLGIMAQMFGRDFEKMPQVYDQYSDELALYPVPAVLDALRRCMRELRTFPALADVLARIDDGRPGAEEAWAAIPKSEEESAVWTQEMLEAFGACSSLLDSDRIAARLAFRESYLKAVADARAKKLPTQWTVSLGTDKALRDLALREAIDKRRITLSQAQLLLPEFNIAPPKARAQIQGPADAPSLEAIQGVIARVLDGAPEHVKAREAVFRSKQTEAEAKEHEERVAAQLEALKKNPDHSDPTQAQAEPSESLKDEPKNKRHA